MRKTAIIPAWGRILRGRRPFLSIEITKECPLKCPGCYAYEPGHLNDGRPIVALTDWRGEELVDRILELVRRFRPLHVSFVGGEPLVRYRELTRIIPRLATMGIEVQVVTSGVRPIPAEWTEFADLHLVLSVDGLQAEHDTRRTPATYDRILGHIDGHRIIIHCTVVPQFLAREDYLRDFARFWSAHAGVRKIWFSLFTPQIGDRSPQRLTAVERATAIARIAALRSVYTKVYAPEVVLDGYRHPPESPSECIFAQTTRCVSVDLSTPVVPCQIGGRPECTECGCMAAAGLTSIGKVKLAGLLKVSDVFTLSRKVGERFSGRDARA